MKFEDKAVLITGASRGLGAALAENFAKNRARVVLVARSEEELKQTVDKIRLSGGIAFGVVGDVSQKEDIYKVSGQAQALVGPIDILINNASSLGPTPLRYLLDIECEDFESVLQTNTIGPFRLIKALAGSMALRGSGHVVNISSDAAVEAYPKWGIYSASKAALDHLTRVFSKELEGTGVKFLSIDPGEMNTKMHADAIPDADPSSLTSPYEVAQRIISIVSKSENLESGVRLTAKEGEEYATCTFTKTRIPRRKTFGIFCLY